MAGVVVENGISTTYLLRKLEVIMRRLLVPLLALSLSLRWTPPILAEEDAKAIIEKAIQAQGLVERDKFKAARFKSKGTVYQDELTISYTEDQLLQGYEKVKSAEELKFNGQSMKYKYGYDGKKAWMIDEDGQGGVPAKAPDKKDDPTGAPDKSEVALAASLTNELYLWRVVGLTSLMNFIVKPGPAKDSDDAKIAPLIRLLGDPTFDKREKASKDLLAIGEPAVPALEKAQRSNDREVARRADHLLSVICSKDIYFDLKPLPEVVVEGKPAVGVRVRSRGHRDIDLYFDRNTNLMVKLARVYDDPLSGEKANETRIIKEYQDIQGVKTIKKAEVFRDGKKYIDMEMIEAKYLDKVDDREFAKP